MLEVSLMGTCKRKKTEKMEVRSTSRSIEEKKKKQKNEKRDSAAFWVHRKRGGRNQQSNHNHQFESKAPSSRFA
jgi:hypothetical protein